MGQVASVFHYVSALCKEMNPVQILLLLPYFSLCLFLASDFSFLLMDPLDIW
jgi:hypothetical protein